MPTIYKKFEEKEVQTFYFSINKISLWLTTKKLTILTKHNRLTAKLHIFKILTISRNFNKNPNNIALKNKSTNKFNQNKFRTQIPVKYLNLKRNQTEKVNHFS